MSSPQLLIIVVNFRTPALTLDCLSSLAYELGSVDRFRVVVVDNGSADNSSKTIRERIEREQWGNWCSLLELDRNLGFAGGNNAGIEWAWERDTATNQSRAPFVLLLNSDTVVHTGCLRECVATMNSSPQIGAMSCKLLNADGTLQIVSRKYMSPTRLVIGAIGLPWKLPRVFGWAQLEYLKWDMNVDSGYPEWIGGAFMMLRTEAMDRVGLLDEDFFFYGEDAEYCFRLRKAGWNILYDPTTTTTHLGGASSDPTRLMTEARSRAVWRSRYLFLRKCYGGWAVWIVRGVDIVMVSAKRMWLVLTRRTNSVRGQQLRLTHQTILGRYGPL